MSRGFVERALSLNPLTDPTLVFRTVIHSCLTLKVVQSVSSGLHQDRNDLRSVNGLEREKNVFFHSEEHVAYCQGLLGYSLVV